MITVIDECSLQRGFDAGNLGEVDISLYLLLSRSDWGSSKPPDASVRHTVLKPVYPPLTYIQAVESVEKVAQAGNWRFVQDRFVNSDVEWTGYVVESNPPEFHLIRPRKESVGEKWEEAIITLKDPSTHRLYDENACVTVSGWVHRWDAKGINIVGATIKPAS